MPKLHFAKRRNSIGVLFLVILCWSILIASVQAESPNRYTDAMFRKALANGSTAPNYVLVTIRDINTNVARLVCIEAPFLLGALHTEYGIAYDNSGRRKLLQLALASSERIYTFSKAKALENVAPRYTPEKLAEIRAALALKTDAELSDQDVVVAIDEKYAAHRDAVAHVLLERGILCGRGCYAGELFISR